MIAINGMDDYHDLCKKKLVDWYNAHGFDKKITVNNTYVVWACKTLQNYKALLSTDINGDGIYAEYTYNGDKHELYEDVYGKIQNTCHIES